MSQTDSAETVSGRVAYPSEERRCTAHKAGTKERCSVAAIKGGNVCVYHGGRAPQVRAAAEARLLAMADPALAALVEIVTHHAGKETLSVKLQAAKDILDRIGLSGVSKSQLDINVYDTREELMRRAQEIIEGETEAVDVA